MDVTVYQLTFKGDPSGVIHYSLEPHNPQSRFSIGPPGFAVSYEADTSVAWIVSAPKDAKLERDSSGMMVVTWNFSLSRATSRPHEVMSHARLETNGFGNLRQAPPQNS